MKLTAFTDYSLRVLMFLAARPDRLATISDIGAAFDLKHNHLKKIVHHLSAKGWIQTSRGRGGGLVLAMPAESIRIGDVVRDTEGEAVLAECFADGPSQCAIVRCCRLKRVLAGAVAAFYAALDDATLADITDNRQELASILMLDHRASAS